MKVIFRTDASLEIGSGHVMRCLTLAEELEAEGATCIFVCREHKGNMIYAIRQRGYEVIGLPNQSVVPEDFINNEKTSSVNFDSLGAAYALDAEQTKDCIGSEIVDLLVVDHYAIDEKWEKLLRPSCRKIFVIDDMADRYHDCDILLDQNLGRAAQDYKNFVPKGCKTMFGPDYALLRPEFPKLRNYSIHRRAGKGLRNLLISMGGVDYENATGKVLNTLNASNILESFRITIVMGDQASWISEVQHLAEQMNHPIEIKINTKDMAKIMADADLAIGGAGITSWERCCLGLPAIIVVLSNNQRQGAMALDIAGCVKTINSIDSIPTDLPSIFHSLQSKYELQRLSTASMKVTDGLGACRVKEVVYGRR